jgi:hypothetical protein
VVIWSAILKLYGASLGFGSPNLNLNYFCDNINSRTSIQQQKYNVFFPICTWKIAIWLSIGTLVVLTSSIE